MKAIQEAARRFLRGPAVSRQMRRFGIDPHRYWLLIDLFGELTDRREMLGHLGRDGVSMRLVAIIYGALGAFLAAIQILLGIKIGAYFAIFLVITSLMLLMILLSETANSLVNPSEGIVLAHQPINGATYTAAKLTHLLNILNYIVPALNLLPALGGLLLPGASWTYPLRHLFSAWIVGLVMALLCCAFFGWLIRFVPPARLKIVGQIAELAPMFLAFSGNTRALRNAHFPIGWLANPAVLWAVAIACIALAAAGVVFGIRALSGDYLAHVSAIVHGTSHSTSRRRRRTPLAAAIARIAGGRSGGQAARAGFEFVRRMLVRDWQIRRQLIPLAFPLIMALGAMMRGSLATPFSGIFTPVHLLPHALGAMLVFVCAVLTQGSDYKGAWIFLTVGGSTFHGFVRGVHSLLWTAVILFPHLALFAFLVWKWGPLDALLFISFSLAIASIYLALELRLIEGLPLGRPVETAQGMVLLPLMMGGGLVIAIMVALQHFLLFHSRLLVFAVTLPAAASAYLITRGSLNAFENAIRYHLGLVSQESTMLYREVEG